MTIQRIARAFLFALILLCVAACEDKLLTGLSEEESNEIIALLQSRGISVSKTMVDKEGVSLSVDTADLASAIEVLRQHGFPRDQFNDLGTIFDKEGLISSPLEERARFIYAISETISETLSQIDGVVKARVFVNVPESNRLDEKPPEASASVFLKVGPGVNLENKIPDIKMIVQNSVEGLRYDDVVVVLFEAAPPPATIDTNGPAMSELLGVRFTSDSGPAIIAAGAVIGLLLLAAIGGNALLLMRLRKIER